MRLAMRHACGTQVSHARAARAASTNLDVICQFTLEAARRIDLDRRLGARIESVEVMPNNKLTKTSVNQITELPTSALDAVVGGAGGAALDGAGAGIDFKAGPDAAAAQVWNQISSCREMKKESERLAEIPVAQRESNIFANQARVCWDQLGVDR